jgi:hypothetical protein
MRLRFAAIIALGLALATAPFVLAQTTPPENVSGANGVVIDAQGVLRLQHFPDPGGALTKKRIAEARTKLKGDVAKASPLRKVSLNGWKPPCASGWPPISRPTKRCSTWPG